MFVQTHAAAGQLRFDIKMKAYNNTLVMRPYYDLSTRPCK